MAAAIGACLFAIVAVMTALVAYGLPLGEFTMGGKHRILPPKLRVMAGISFVIQVFAILIILQAGGIIAPMFSVIVAKYICLFFAVYLSFNTVMNILSTSKKERYFGTPISVAAAVCFWITALNR